MKIILEKNKLSQFTRNKKNLGFVPTMGGIHAGHISLITRSINQCKRTIVSIFVNKQQFNNRKDFVKYPRVLKKDILKLRDLKIDILYLPKEKDIYPDGYNRKIEISSFKKKLCGKFRKGHFEGVADVVDRFLKIINPNKIYFGEKDFQQLKILEDFIKKNHSYCKVVHCKTIRDKNGIACSTRNNLLNNKEKMIASKIVKLIRNNKNKLIKKKIKVNKIKNILYSMKVKKIDYIEILNINKLIKPFKKGNKYKIFFAYYLNKTRLIDNI
ncbi:pantoate--beta-alanine ligase [Pelagibacteraceae bacterium]|nr:pantoate--beta-alanine ligase [Pelagibacteraceae bacterium]